MTETRDAEVDFATRTRLRARARVLAEHDRAEREAFWKRQKAIMEEKRRNRVA